MPWLTGMVRGGLVIAAVGLCWMQWPSQDADERFDPTVAQPAFTTSPRPRVLVDEGHLNVHTSSGRYRPLTRLLERDGFRVLPSEGRISARMLRGGDLFVTANPLGYIGLAQHVANVAGLERMVRLPSDAYDAEEIRQLTEWVANGGRALIVADHAPAGLAARHLAAAFGVEMTNWWAEDRGAAEITFSRANGGLGDHPIVDGRNQSERVETVTTFSGQALKPPPGAAVLLRLSSAAREYPFRHSREEEGRSAAGLAQAVALHFGKGRVVVLGEAAAISAQRIETPGAPAVLIGMNRPGADNKQFALNVVHWLSGLNER